MQQDTTTDENPYTLCWEYSLGEPTTSGNYRVHPEEFCVIEHLGYDLEGTGEHLFLSIEKRGCNTVDVAQALAALFKRKLFDVGYSGLKDKHAVTRQWFSVYLPGVKNIPDNDAIVAFISQFKAIVTDGGSVNILGRNFHSKKLRTGTHKSNRFVITLRDIQGEHADIEKRIEAIQKEGVPNYFGIQRFGNGGMNLVRAQNLFDGELRTKNKKLQGMYLSAARSLLFNAVLSERVVQKKWNKVVAGDLFTFETSNALFNSEPSDPLLQKRVDEWDIHPTGPLFGVGAKKAPTEEALTLEQEVLAQFPSFSAGLSAQKVGADRRALRLKVSDLSYLWIEADVMTLSFELIRGAFATSVLREICNLSLPKR